MRINRHLRSLRLEESPSFYRHLEQCLDCKKFCQRAFCANCGELLIHDFMTALGTLPARWTSEYLKRAYNNTSDSALKDMAGRLKRPGRSNV